MSGISAVTLKTMIKNYTEVDDTVLTDAILENIILNAQQRIMYDVPIDADRKQQSASLIVGQQTYNCPAGCLFIRGIQVYTATDGTITGDNTWLLKRDQTFLNEYKPDNTSKGTPKYYAMFGGATGLSDTTSGRFMVAPTPSATFSFQIHYNIVQSILEGEGTNYISLNFPQGLLYCCLAETYGFLKGPTDMLTLYENKYKQEIEKFAAMQIGRRRRDDYTDGTVRIPIESPPQ
jgi:hypothetical protein